MLLLIASSAFVLSLAGMLFLLGFLFKKSVGFCFIVVEKRIKETRPLMRKKTKGWSHPPV